MLCSGHERGRILFESVKNVLLRVPSVSDEIFVVDEPEFTLPVEVLTAYVIHWRAPTWCYETVSSLLRSHHVRLNVVVLDNSSDEMPYRDNRIEVVPLNENLGYTGAANIAIQRFVDGHERYLILCSHDLDVPPDALWRMTSVFRAEPSIKVLGLGHESESVPVRPGAILLKERYFVGGSCMVTEREAVIKIGLLPVGFGSYVEDVFWGFKCWDLGFRCAIMVDRTLRTRGSIESRSHRLVARNLVYLVQDRRGTSAAWSMRLVQATEGALHLARGCIRGPGKKECRSQGLQSIAGAWDSISRPKQRAAIPQLVAHRENESR